MDMDDAHMADGDNLAPAGELGPDADAFEADPTAEAVEPETVEIEFDGQLYAVPLALKGGFLRQADYTRKTQELAEHRRAVEAERQALEAQRRAAAGANRDRAHLAALDQQLEAFAGLDWESLGEADPDRAQALWARFQDAEALRADYADAVSRWEADERAASLRDAAEQMAETGRKLREEIDGWSPEVAARLVDYAQSFGVTLDELAEVADARLWKILHRAWRADEAQSREAAQSAQAVRPAVLVSGVAAAGGVRDELATAEWMARRNQQMLKGR